MTRCLIVCSSVHHHNTARVAAALAATLEARVAAVAEAHGDLLAEHDLIGIGSGIYHGGVHPELLRWVRGLPASAGLGKRAFLFTTSGLPFVARLWLGPLRAAVRHAGFEPSGEFHCRGFDTWGPLGIIGGINRGHPDARDLERAAAFARSLIAVGPAAAGARATAPE
jgi:flavodoxin